MNELLNDLTWINLVILAMGSYSITRLFVTDSLLDRPRLWLFRHFPYEGYASEGKPKRGEVRRTSNNVYLVTKGTFIGDLFSCPWCLGWWVSLIICVSFFLFPAQTVVVLLPFALRAFVGGYANKVGG